MLKKFCLLPSSARCPTNETVATRHKRLDGVHARRNAADYFGVLSCCNLHVFTVVPKSAKETSLELCSE